MRQDGRYLCRDGRSQSECTLYNVLIKRTTEIIICLGISCCTVILLYQIPQLLLKLKKFQMETWRGHHVWNYILFCVLWQKRNLINIDNVCHFNLPHFSFTTVVWFGTLIWLRLLNFKTWCWTPHRPSSLPKQGRKVVVLMPEKTSRCSIMLLIIKYSCVDSNDFVFTFQYREKAIPEYWWLLYFNFTFENFLQLWIKVQYVLHFTFSSTII